LAVPDDDKDEVDGPIGERKSTQQIAKDLFGVRQQQVCYFIPLIFYIGLLVCQYIFQQHLPLVWSNCLTTSSPFSMDYSKPNAQFYTIGYCCSFFYWSWIKF
jgi:hypothetical protein